MPLTPWVSDTVLRLMRSVTSTRRVHLAMGRADHSIVPGAKRACFCADRMGQQRLAVAITTGTACRRCDRVGLSGQAARDEQKALGGCVCCRMPPCFELADERVRREVEETPAADRARPSRARTGCR